MLLDAHVVFYDLLIRYTSLETMSRGLDIVETDIASIHDEFAMQKEPYPVCVSNFTGCPVVFEMCKAHVRGLHTVLDVGCRAGHVARQLMVQGATNIVAVDINRTMVEAENLHLEKNRHVKYYVEGNASRRQKRPTLCRGHSSTLESLICVSPPVYSTTLQSPTWIRR